MCLVVADLAVDDYVHDDAGNLYRVADAEKLMTGRILIRLENAHASFVADDGEPFYDVRLFSEEDVGRMEVVEFARV